MCQWVKKRGKVPGDLRSGERKQREMCVYACEREVDGKSSAWRWADVSGWPMRSYQDTRGHAKSARVSCGATASRGLGTGFGWQTGLSIPRCACKEAAEPPTCLLLWRERPSSAGCYGGCLPTLPTPGTRLPLSQPRTARRPPHKKARPRRLCTKPEIVYFAFFPFFFFPLFF